MFLNSKCNALKIRKDIPKYIPFLSFNNVNFTIRNLSKRDNNQIFTKRIVTILNTPNFCNATKRWCLQKNHQLMDNRWYSSKETDSIPKKDESENTKEEKLTSTQKFKTAIKDYGGTVIVFHVSISLISLGISYLLVSSGVDVVNLLTTMGLSQNEKIIEIASSAGTFVVAYAFHKVFAPVRMSITLAATPFIVRYLRRIGVLKPPKPKP